MIKVNKTCTRNARYINPQGQYHHAEVLRHLFLAFGVKDLIGMAS